MLFIIFANACTHFLLEILNGGQIENSTWVRFGDFDVGRWRGLVIFMSVAGDVDLLCN